MLLFWDKCKHRGQPWGVFQVGSTLGALLGGALLRPKEHTHQLPVGQAASGPEWSVLLGPRRGPRLVATRNRNLPDNMNLATS